MQSPEQVQSTSPFQFVLHLELVSIDVGTLHSQNRFTYFIDKRN